MRGCICVFVVCVYMVCESAKCVGVWCVCEIANARVYVSLYAYSVNVLVQM